MAGTGLGMTTSWKFQHQRRNTMKHFGKLLITAILFIFSAVLAVRADDVADIKAFFDNYVNAANSYDSSLVDYYSPNAKIIRYVIQEDGTIHPKPLVTGMDEYTKQLKLGSAGAKLRRYKNYYSNVNIAKQGSGYKISASRRPSTSDYSLPAYFVVNKDSSGKYRIIEEMMQTKAQMLLRYID